jgi:hypothetical protein
MTRDSQESRYCYCVLTNIQGTKIILKLYKIACRVPESRKDFDTVRQARCGNKLSDALPKTLRVTMEQERGKT